MKTSGFPTLEDRLIAVRRRPSGFDYLRLGLALLVFLAHTMQIVGSDAAALPIWHGPLRPFLIAILPMFFALSGFLVAGSLERCRTMVSFFGLRIMRIVPALAFETLLSAFVLGPLFTTFALGDYFTNIRFYSYLLNIVGDVHMTLPGVFVHNTYPDTVNGQLWVLPRELKCYILLGALCVLGLVKPTRQTLIFSALLYVATCAWFAFVSPQQAPPFTVAGWVLILSFIAGVMAYVYRKHIPFNLPLFALSVAVTVFLLSRTQTEALAPLPLTYLTVYLGLCNPPRSRLITSGDFSYGIYLYGFPVQQAVAALGAWTAHWYINIALALPVTVLLAMASWFFVEKPVLKLRPLLTALEDRAISARHAMRIYWMDWVRRSLSNE